MGIRNLFRSIFGSTFQLNDDDIVVFLVGPSGSGKSAFVNDVTSSTIVVAGTSLRPSTKTPQAIRCELTDEAKSQLRVSSQNHIVFVDTPSFHTNRKNDVAEKETENWLNNANFRSTRTGIIYMHRIEDPPGEQPIQKHLSTFARTFPESVVSPVRLHVVLSQEDRPTADKIRRHCEALRGQLNDLPTRYVYGRWDDILNTNRFHLQLQGRSETARKAGSETAWQAVVTLFSTAR